MQTIRSKLLIYVISILFNFSILTAESNSARNTIMPLGDSITYDNRLSDLENPRPLSKRTAYRSHLWYKLIAANYLTNFVGSRIAGESIVPKFDPNNEGHPGWSSYDISERIYEYLTKNHADIVLLHIGTNDHSSSVIGVESLLNEIDLYETQSGREVRVLVALIIDTQKLNNETIRIFNKNLQTMVGRRIKFGDALTLVDMYKSAKLTRADYADILHPTDQGYQKMATVWFNEITKPYNAELTAFPYILVDSVYIQSSNIDPTGTSVEFITKIPDTGIIF